MVARFGQEGQVCETGHWLNPMNQQHCQLVKACGRFSMSDKSVMEQLQVVTERLK